MNIIVITPPPEEPVTLAECYKFLRLDPDDDGTHPDDDMLIGMITAAREDCEKRTNRAFVEQTLRQVTRVERFGPNGCGACFSGGLRYIEMARSPCQLIVAVRYYDGAGALQDIDDPNFYLTNDEPRRLQFVDGYGLPSTQDRNDAFQVDFVAGYPMAASDDYRSNVPRLVRQAILIGVQLQYDQLSPEQRERLEDQQTAFLRNTKVWSFD